MYLGVYLPYFLIFLFVLSCISFVIFTRVLLRRVLECSSLSLCRIFSVFHLFLLAIASNR